MTTLAGFPYSEIRFDRDGGIVDPGEVDGLLARLSGGSGTDLVFLSHGWNNDMAEARNLYRRLCESLRRVRDGRAAPDGEVIEVLGVFWPSKKFAERDLIPGGAASLGDGDEGERLRRELRELRGFFDAPEADARLEEMVDLVERLEDDVEAQRTFVEDLRNLVPDEGGLDEEDGRAVGALHSTPADELLLRAADPVAEDSFGPGGAAGVGTAGTGGSAGAELGGVAGRGIGGSAGARLEGGAAGLDDIFGGALQGARRLLNLVTYYEMKKRAGIVGGSGVAELLGRIRSVAPDMRIHLVGHSFGGRLVTAAAAASDVGGIDSMTLLQAAFSHYGFARDYHSTGRDGAFRSVVADGRVKGPILITHTANDRAVGLSYPIASRIARQAASGLGDRRDLYGGIGRNGAVDTPEAEDGLSLLTEDGDYDFVTPGSRIFNLESSAFIADHGSVTGPEVANAVLAAVRSRSVP